MACTIIMEIMRDAANMLLFEHTEVPLFSPSPSILFKVKFDFINSRAGSSTFSPLGQNSLQISNFLSRMADFNHRINNREHIASEATSIGSSPVSNEYATSTEMPPNSEVPGLSFCTEPKSCCCFCAKFNEGITLNFVAHSSCMHCLHERCNICILVY